ncbi:hypothetical protein [Methylobacter sp.]
MPQVLIVNGKHVGIFSSFDSASMWMEENHPDSTYQVVDLDLFYETDFTHE